MELISAIVSILLHNHELAHSWFYIWNYDLTIMHASIGLTI